MNHLNQKSVIRLGVAALLAIAVAVAINASRKPRSEEAAQKVSYALPELREHVNDVSALHLTGAGEALLVSIKRGTSGWQVENKGGYPADTSKVREFLLKLTDASLLEPKTNVADRYPELGVGDVKTADAKGVLVALDGLASPQQLIIGNPNTRSSGTYVRRAGETQSWLAKGSLTPEKTAASWLDKAVLDVPATRIKEISLSRPDGSTLRVFKNKAEDSNYTVANLPKGRSLSSEFAANGLASTLAGLNLEDVFAASDTAAAKSDKEYKASYRSFDGVLVEITAWLNGDKHLAQIKVSLDQVQADAAIAVAQATAKAEWEASKAAAEASSTDTAKTEAKADGAAADIAAKPAAIPQPLAVSDADKDRNQRLDAVKAEIATMAARVDGWVFVLPAYKFSNMDKSMNDLLKPLEEASAAGKSDGKKPATDLKSALKAGH